MNKKNILERKPMQTDKQATAAKLDYAVDIRETTRS